MNKHPIWYLVIGIFILVVPTVVYLGFLIPQLTEAYNVLMASGGVIGGSGFYAAQRIPKKLKYSGLFKLAANSFTIFIVLTLVNQFIMKIIGLVAVFVVSFIIFQILKGAWQNGRRKKENAELAEEITRSVTETSK